MKAFIAIFILLAVAMVNSHEFSGPLNLKDIKSSTFNLEEENKLVVGTETGQIYVSKFAKNKQIFNYKAEKKHKGKIIGIKRLPLTGQFITVDENGGIFKWNRDFKRVIRERIFQSRQEGYEIKSVAFVYNEATLRANRVLALNFQDEIVFLATSDLAILKTFSQADLNTTEHIDKITFVNGFLCIFGQRSQIISTIQPKQNWKITQIFKGEEISIKFIGQFNSDRDDRKADGFLINGQNNLHYFDLSNTTVFPNSTGQVRFQISDGDLSSLTYCKRTNYNSAAKVTGQKLETVLLVAFDKQFVFYLWNSTSKAYEAGETYYAEGGIKEIQCYEDEIFLLTKNGPNDQLVTISLQYVYEDSDKSKAAGYAAFVFATLIAILVAYQVKKQKLQKKLAQEVTFTESKYVELEERVTVSKSYNH